MTQEELEKVIESRDKLRKKLEKELKEKKDKKTNIRDITYYTEFEMVNQTDLYSAFSEEEVFVVEKEIEVEGEKQTVHEFYDRDHKKIAFADKDGKMVLEKEYQERIQKQLGEYYKLLGLEDKNRKLYLTKNYKTIEQAMEQNYRSKEVDYRVSGEENPEPQEKETEEKKRKNKVDVLDKNLIGEDLGIDPNDLTHCIRIKDKRFYEKVPEARNFDGDAVLAYSRKENKFIICGSRNGKYVPCESVDPSYGTMKTSIDLDRTGENVEKQPIMGIMKIKGNPNFDFAVNLEFGGIVEFQELRIDESTGKYISADLCTQGQYQTSWDVEQMMNKGVNRNIHDEVMEYETEKKHGAESSIESLQAKECTKEEKEKEDHDFDRGERTYYRQRPWDD